MAGLIDLSEPPDPLASAMARLNLGGSERGGGNQHGRSGGSRSRRPQRTVKDLPIACQPVPGSDRRCHDRGRSGGSEIPELSQRARARMKRQKRQCNRALAEGRRLAALGAWRAAQDAYEQAQVLLRVVGDATGMEAKVLKKLAKIEKKRAKGSAKRKKRKMQEKQNKKKNKISDSSKHEGGSDGLDSDGDDSSEIVDNDGEEGHSCSSSSSSGWSFDNSDDVDANNFMVPQARLPGGFCLPSAGHHDKLFPHQREGVAWMWHLFRRGEGGVLADDMGLGKTVQVVTFFRGMFAAAAASSGSTTSTTTGKRHRHRQVGLVVAPVSVVPGWCAEFQRWAPEIRVCTVHGLTRTKRASAVGAVLRKGGVLVTTYGMVRNQRDLFSAAGPEWKRCVDAAAAQQAAASTSERKVRQLRRRLDGSRFNFSCVVLDEGQAIKNHRAQISQAVRGVPSRQRLILTGTPIQNNLTELWALFDYVGGGAGDALTLEGIDVANATAATNSTAASEREKQRIGANTCECLSDEEWLLEAKKQKTKNKNKKHTHAAKVGFLGSLSQFRRRIADHIEAANETDATERERAAGQDASSRLADILAPFLMRRTKQSVFGDGAQGNSISGDSTTTAATTATSAATATAPRAVVDETAAVAAATAATTQDGRPGLTATKTDLVVWLPLSQTQRQYYRAFLDSAQVKQVLNTTGSPLVAIDVLRKICQHPALLRGAGAVAVASRFCEDAGGELLQDVSAYKSASSTAASSKLAFLCRLLPRLRRDGHRTLVFCSTRIMLDCIEAACDACGIRSLRIDGTVTRIAERQRRVDLFNDCPDAHDVMLLTLGVGGVGLTLTGADRVVLFDPSWNPTVDRQAVDRAFRIGQQRNVVCYRLVTCSTVEEAIFRRQVYKDGGATTVMKTQLARAWSSREELRQLFQLTDPDRSLMCDQAAHLRPAGEEDGKEEEAVLLELGAYGISWNTLISVEGLESAPNGFAEGQGGRGGGGGGLCRGDAGSPDRAATGGVCDFFEEEAEESEQEAGEDDFWWQRQEEKDGENIGGLWESCGDDGDSLSGTRYGDGDDDGNGCRVTTSLASPPHTATTEAAKWSAMPCAASSEEDDGFACFSSPELDGAAATAVVANDPDDNRRPQGSVCKAHWDVFLEAFPDPEVVRCTRCRCYAEASAVAKHERLLADANKVENSLLRLESLMAAIELVDDSPALHAQLLTLARKHGIIEDRGLPGTV